MSSDHCTIRAAAASDAATIARHRYPEPQADPADLAAYSGWLVEKLATDTYLGVLAVSEAQVVAGAGLLLLDWGPTRGDPNPLRGRIVNVYTDPDWRRRGLARRLTLALLERARALGIQSIGLSSTDTARALYQRLGFTVQERELLWRTAATRPAP